MLGSRKTGQSIVALAWLLAPALAGEAGYRLRPSDIITVQYRYTPEYNQDATVQPDGCVSLPLVGQVKVGGLGVEDARERIRHLAASRLRDPEVTVLLKEFEKPAFFVMGEVNTPGRFEMRSPVTVTQAIAMGGGFKNTARHSQVILFRSTENGMREARVLDLKSMLRPAASREEPILRPGDLLMVPPSRTSRIERYLRWGTFGIYVPIPGL